MTGYREICLRHHGEECWVCGAEAPEDDPAFIQAHHINGYWWHDRPENLLPLCRPCHMKVHTRSRTFSGEIGKLQAVLWASNSRYPMANDLYEIEYDGDELKIVRK